MRDFIATAPDPDTLNVAERRKLIGHLGYGISSIERHARDRGGEIGQGTQLVPGSEALFVQLGKLLRHPPRDSLHTIITWNVNPTISFTGQREEHVFFDMTRRGAQAVENIRDLLHPITSQDAPWQLSSNVDDLLRATLQVMEMRRQFARGMPSAGELTPEFFLGNLRQYLCPWKIEGKVLSGPSGANTIAQIEVDYLLGVNNQGYVSDIAKRRENFTVDERLDIDKALRTPQSLLGLIRRALTTDKDPTPLASRKNATNSLENASQDIRDFVAAAGSLLWEWGTASAFHFAAIRNLIVRPQSAGAVLADTAAVDNAKGTSGMEFTEVEDLMHMRRHHPVVSDLHEALRAGGFSISTKTLTDFSGLLELTGTGTTLSG